MAAARRRRTEGGFGRISRRDVLRLGAELTLAAALGGCVRSKSSAVLPQLPRASDVPSGRRPNIVFLLIDDLGYHDVGFLGTRLYSTPRMDALAASGVVFTSAYAAGPNCAPSRASLMSGQYPPRHGIYTVGSSARGRAEDRKLIPVENRRELSPEVVTLAEALHAAGYVCGSIGKWHLGKPPETDPLAQGFDVNVAGFAGGSVHSHFSPYGIPGFADGPEREYLTYRLTDEAVRFIEEHREEPFFLYLSHYAVHIPIQAPGDLVRKYRGDERFKAGRARHEPWPPPSPRYAAMVEAVDRSVGRVLDTLERLGLRDNTLVILFSDNGPHPNYTSTRPLRGHKGQLYEGGIREPLVISWPGVLPAGRRVDVPVCAVDFYPTILELTRTSPPAQPLDGLSLVPLLTGRGEFPERPLFWHFPAYLPAIKGGRHGRGRKWRQTPAGAVRLGPWKLIEFFETGKVELYNLDLDPGEKHNLANEMPERAEQLRTLLARWRQEIHAPMPVPVGRR